MEFKMHLTAALIKLLDIRNPEVKKAYVESLIKNLSIAQLSNLNTLCELGYIQGEDIIRIVDGYDPEDVGMMFYIPNEIDAIYKGLTYALHRAIYN